MTASKLPSVSSWNGLSVLVLSPTPTHPQDYGNRKRVYEVCSRLKRWGAKIHFVHYASEAEWRGNVPRAHEDAMRDAWDSYTTVPPSRQLHNSPKGDYHEIDEWWDPSIGNHLSWIFQTRHIDVLLVNYTWLTQAFSYAPQGVFKILDTHDHFSGRKELLQANGLAPEFFYLTSASESAGFRRADLIWAIKGEEAEIFRGMTDTPVLTMLHSEPEQKSAKTPAPDPDGYVRFGIVGARNNVNLENFRRFYKIARDRFVDSLAPIKLVLAGSWTADLAEYEDDPFIEFQGRVPDISDFYNAVDAVLIPMEFSTGLKIKTGEAIFHGKPIVSHVHAFEGYPARHKMHSLKTFEDVAEACIDLSYSPSLLAGLQTASIIARRELDTQVVTAFGETVRKMLSLKQPLIIAASSSICKRGTLQNQFIGSVSAYMKALANFVLYIDGDVTLAELENLRRLGVSATVTLRESSFRALADQVSQHALEQLDVRPDSLQQLVERRGAKRVFLLDALPDASSAITDDVTLYLQLDMIRMAGNHAQRKKVLAAATAKAGRVIGFSAGDDLAAIDWLGVRIDEHVRAPFFYDTREVEILNRWWRAEPEGAMALTAGTKSQLAILRILAARIEGPFQIVVAEGCDAGAVKAAFGGVPDIEIVTCASIFAAPEKALHKPVAVIDLCPGETSLTVVRELLERSSVPVVNCGLGATGTAAGPPSRKNRTPLQAVSVYLDALESHDVRTQLMVGRGSNFRNDAGWAYVWTSMRNVA
ncbi:MAG: glycosyltransferase [Hyphomonadaceae bacterium]